MHFSIQAGKPKFQISNGITAEDLSEAIQIIFPMETDDASINWNGTFISMSYKYDLSVMIDDLLPLLLSVQVSDEGQYRVHFGSNTFNTEWQISWKSDELLLNAHWEENFEDLNLVEKNCSRLKISRTTFLKEWNGVLENLRQSVESSGVSIKRTLDCEFLNHLAKLK